MNLGKEKKLHPSGYLDTVFTIDMMSPEPLVLSELWLGFGCHLMTLPCCPAFVKVAEELHRWF